MAGHVIDVFHRSGLFFPGSSLTSGWIYSFHMPFMFMISGYVDGLHGASCNVLHRLRRCIISVYLPCLYFSLMIWLPKFLWSFLSISNAENFKLASLRDLFMIPFYGFDIYWFISSLFFIKVFHIITGQAVPSQKIRTLFWVALFIIHWLRPSVHSFLYYGLYFHTGYMLRQAGLITRENHPGISRGIILFFVGTSIFTLSYFGGTNNILTRAGAAFCLSLAMFVMFYAWDAGSSFLAFCGVNSMVIYVIHGLVISPLRLFFRWSGLSESGNTFMLFAVCCALGVAVPLLVVMMYRKVKCLRWIEYVFYPGKLLR